MKDLEWITTNTPVYSASSKIRDRKIKEKYFDSKRAKKYLDIINSINEKAEKKIESIRKKRDKQVGFYDTLLIIEKAKPAKENFRGAK